MRFQNWIKLVDQELENTCGLSSDDLADRPYRDQFEDGVTPADAATECLEYNDFPL
jgi:hypothetical protein